MSGTAMAEESLVKARQAGMNYLAGRDRSVHEMRQKLQGMQFDADLVEQVIADFERLHLVDDRAFARRWVEVRVEGRGAGPAKLAQDLWRKGIERSIVDEVLEEFADALGSAEKAVELLRKKSRRYAGLGAQKAQRRMYDFLARRGYKEDVVTKAVKQVWEEIRENDLQGD